MRIKLPFTILLLFLTNFSFGQTSKILTKQETENLKTDIDNISFPVYRAYKYNDKNGYYNLLLCENQQTINKKDTLNSKIEAVCYLEDHGGYIKKWTIFDQIETSKTEAEDNENTIYFWTKYCSVSDIDKDNEIDPIIVYGTKTEYGFRRIKIFTLYKGKKYVIRAVENTLDYGRTFKKDDSFKQLPIKIRQYIDKLMDKMRAEQDILLKNG